MRLWFPFWKSNFKHILWRPHVLEPTCTLHTAPSTHWFDWWIRKRTCGLCAIRCRTENFNYSSCLACSTAFEAVTYAGECNQMWNVRIRFELLFQFDLHNAHQMDSFASHSLRRPWTANRIRSSLWLDLALQFIPINTIYAVSKTKIICFCGLVARSERTSGLAGGRALANALLVAQFVQSHYCLINFISVRSHLPPRIGRCDVHWMANVARPLHLVVAVRLLMLSSFPFSALCRRNQTDNTIYEVLRAHRARHRVLGLGECVRTCAGEINVNRSSSSSRSISSFIWINWISVLKVKSDQQNDIVTELRDGGRALSVPL